MVFGEGVVMSKWISVKEKLPKYDKNVLVYFNECYTTEQKGLAIAQLWPNKQWEISYNGLDGYDINSDVKTITHWQELPNLPDLS